MGSLVFYGTRRKPLSSDYELRSKNPDSSDEVIEKENKSPQCKWTTFNSQKAGLSDSALWKKYSRLNKESLAKAVPAAPKAKPKKVAKKPKMTIPKKAGNLDIQHGISSSKAN